jgi:hypothetical protein
MFEYELPIAVVTLEKTLASRYFFDGASGC